ncbi:choice-of-anchor I family protein [Aquipuribacter sp. SD81]|uniref:choice-of-anchor I family protein n=1 Tax=Aquipuribacter sp. SD81 TaxID=3127703 RepID=UPI003018114F
MTSDLTPFPALVSGSALAVLVVTGVVLAPSAEAGPGGAPGRPASTVSLEPLGTYSGGGFDESAAEIPAFDPATDRVFVVNAERGTVDVLDASDPSHLVKVGELDTPGANSVDVDGGLLAVAEEADVATEAGSVAFVDTATLRELGRVRVGALPDMLTFTPDGRHVLVANEGEPEGYEAGQVDPEGSISVIAVPRNGVPDQADVRTAGFGAFDDDVDALRAAGVRVFGPGASVSEDLEPEYVAVDARSRAAWVSLQEANALAVVDIATARVTDVLPLGLKDHSLAGNGLDASDRDGAVDIRTWPVHGMYMPDSVDAYRARGRTYLVLANEGDAREYDGFEEEVRVKDLELDPATFGGPDAVAALQADAALGRLTSTVTSPADADGRVTRIDVFGGRSFSIRDAEGRLVFDSGDDLEQVLAELVAAGELPREAFNADNAENDSFDNRSDNKGPEPEGIEVGSVAGRTYAFVGLERVGGVIVYDITVPSAARFVDYVNVRDFAGDLAANGTDSGPEGLVFVAAADSPTGEPLLVVGNEVSGTTTVYRVTGR